MEIRGQVRKVSSFFSPFGVQGLNSGPQAWEQVLPAQEKFVVFKTVSSSLGWPGTHDNLG